MKHFKEYIVEYEISHDGHGNYRDDEGNTWTSRTGSAHRSSFGRRHTITSHEPDHPHAVHINGKKWKTFGSHSHATNVARKIQGATVHREEVQIDELSDTTLMNYAQKVHDDSLKHDKDPSKRSAAKRSKSVMGFSRAINKLESRSVKEDLDEAAMSARLRFAMALKREEEKRKLKDEARAAREAAEKKEKAPVKEELSDPVRNAKQNKDIATGKKPMPKRKLAGFKQQNC